MEKARIIEKLIDERGLSKRAFAESIGLPPTTLQSILKRGVSKASIDNIIKICRGLGITVEDLEHFSLENEQYQSKKMYSLVNEESFLYNIKRDIQIPYYGCISAGVLERVDGVTNDNVEKIIFPERVLGKHSFSSDLFAMKVNGESMNKLIQNKSLVICKRIEIDEIKDGDIVVFSYDGEYSMKRFRKVEEDQVLIFSPESTDKRFRDVVIPCDAPNDLRIYAKVVWYSVVLD